MSLLLVQLPAAGAAVALVMPILVLRYRHRSIGGPGRSVSTSLAIGRWEPDAARAYRIGTRHRLLSPKCPNVSMFDKGYHTAVAAPFVAGVPCAFMGLFY
jgi:hypothetical protein